jgi:hypothetical protein
MTEQMQTAEMGYQDEQACHFNRTVDCEHIDPTPDQALQNMQTTKKFSIPALTQIYPKPGRKEQKQLQNHPSPIHTVNSRTQRL